MSNGVIDKQHLYGRYQSGEDRMAKQEEERQKLALKTAHKALDIPFGDGEEMNIQANRYQGIGSLAAVGIALATGIPSAILGTYLLCTLGDRVPEKPVEKLPVVTPEAPKNPVEVGDVDVNARMEYEPPK